MQEARRDASRTARDPVDFDHLRRYTLGDRDLEAEVLELFCQQATIAAGQLAAARSEAGWRMAAHTLKGSARAVGAWKLAAAAEVAELLGPGQDASPMAASNAEAALAEARSFLASLDREGAR